MEEGGSVTCNDPMVSVKCIFCGEPEDTVLYPARFGADSFSPYAFSARRKRSREHYRIVSCKCGLVRSDPVLHEDAINSLYMQSELISSVETDCAANTYAELLDAMLKKYAGGKRPESLLEIGCSDGAFLKKAVEYGVQNVVGFEPSGKSIENAADAVKARIINDIFKPELLDGRRFDTACSFHVFDHLMHPKETLQSVTKHLNVGGYVLIACHDVESWSAKLLGSFSPIFDIEHIYLFSKSTLSRLLEESGVKVLDAGSYANTYPLGYWLRMLPAAGALAGILPSLMLNIPLRIRAGNIYAFGRKI